MKILIACEFSGKVRDAFQARGHAANYTWNEKDGVKSIKRTLDIFQGGVKSRRPREYQPTKE